MAKDKTGSVDFIKTSNVGGTSMPGGKSGASAEPSEGVQGWVMDEAKSKKNEVNTSVFTKVKGVTIGGVNMGK